MHYNNVIHLASYLPLDCYKESQTDSACDIGHTGRVVTRYILPGPHNE